jgi:hypothetical protein
METSIHKSGFDPPRHTTRHDASQMRRSYPNKPVAVNLREASPQPTIDSLTSTESEDTTAGLPMPINGPTEAL